MDSTLDELRHLRAKRKAAEFERDQALQSARPLVLQAVKDGVPKARVAEAAGISRWTLYDWLD